MITLAFDTTAKIASVAVAKDKKIIASQSIDNGLTQSELILPMAENMLKLLELSMDDISLLATSVGPGSFTGVRIGVATVKGLAFGRDIRVAAISTLEALAYNLIGTAGIIVPVMDARRNQVYTALFESDGVSLRRLSEDMALGTDELSLRLREYSGRDIYLVGDGYNVAKDRLESDGIVLRGTPALLINENAASVARIGEIMYDEGRTISDRELAASYLRVPQAERERLERLGAEGGNKG